MNIFAAETASSTCPPGCAGHLPDDDGTVHISAEQIVVATSGPEQRELYVSLEVVDQAGAEPAVRLQGAADTPMSPAEALRLASVLTASAFAAVSAWQVGGGR